jgi:uncharacterized SAM-binding protein YcdF (DUF218 family)
MTELLLEIFSLPMPFAILGGAGLALWRARRASRVLLTLAAAGLVLTSLPIVGKIAMAPQLASVETWKPGAGAAPAAVIVPTGGIFEVPAIGWWPSSSSLDRLAAGIETLARAQAAGGPRIPLMVIGGSTQPGAPAEADVLLSRFPGPRPAALVDATARNSAETARAARALLPAAGPGPVVLVTDWLHMARMAASLRHEGFDVRGAPSGNRALDRYMWADLVPQSRGYATSDNALHSWLGVAWYLITGRIGFADLIP